MAINYKQSAIQEVRDQLLLDFADGDYLNNVTTNLGLQRPPFGFSDDTWRAVARLIGLNYKQIVTKFEEVLSVLLGPKLAFTSVLAEDAPIGSEYLVLESTKGMPQVGTLVIDRGKASEETLVYCFVDRTENKVYLESLTTLEHLAENQDICEPLLTDIGSVADVLPVKQWYNFPVGTNILLGKVQGETDTTFIEANPGNYSGGVYSGLGSVSPDIKGLAEDGIISNLSSSLPKGSSYILVNDSSAFPDEGYISIGTPQFHKVEPGSTSSVIQTSGLDVNHFAGKQLVFVGNENPLLAGTIRNIESNTATTITLADPVEDLPSASLAIDLNLTSGSTVIDTGAVATLGDDSGNALHATQGTASKRPLYTASDPDFNGQPSMTFDGVDDGLVTPAFRPGDGGTYWTVYGVVKLGTISVGQQRIFGQTPGGGTGRFTIWQFHAGAGLQFDFSNPGGSYTRLDVAAAPGEVVRFAVVYDISDGPNAIPYIYVNGLLATPSVVSTLAADDTEFDIAPVGIGSHDNGASQFFDGKIARIAGYNALHDVNTIENIDAQLESLYMPLDPYLALPSTDLGIDLHVEAAGTIITSGAAEIIGDDSGNAITASQATASKRPTIIYDDPDFNGRPSISYDGVDDGLVTSAYQPGGGGSDVTVYTVFKTGSKLSDGYIFGGTYSAGAARYAFVQRNSGNNIRVFFSNPGGFTSHIDVPVSPNSVYRLAIVIDAATGADPFALVYLNGVVQTIPIFITSASDAASFESTPYGLGSDSAATGSFFDGKIARVSNYDTAHDLATIRNIDNRLDALYTYPTELAPLEDDLFYVVNLLDLANSGTNDLLLSSLTDTQKTSLAGSQLGFVGNGSITPGTYRDIAYHDTGSGILKLTEPTSSSFTVVDSVFPVHRVKFIQNDYENNALVLDEVLDFPLTYGHQVFNLQPQTYVCSSQVEVSSTGWDTYQVTPRRLDIYIPDELKDQGDLRSATYLHENAVGTATELNIGANAGDAVIYLNDATDWPSITLFQIGSETHLGWVQDLGFAWAVILVNTELGSSYPIATPVSALNPKYLSYPGLEDGNIWTTDNAFPGGYLYDPNNLDNFYNLDNISSLDSTFLAGETYVIQTQFSNGSALEVDDATFYPLVGFPFSVKVGAGTGNQETVDLTDVALKQRTVTETTANTSIGATAIPVTTTVLAGAGALFPNKRGYRIIIDRGTLDAEVAWVLGTTGGNSITVEPLTKAHTSPATVELMADVLGFSSLNDTHVGAISYDDRKTLFPVLSQETLEGAEKVNILYSSFDIVSATGLTPGAGSITVNGLLSTIPLESTTTAIANPTDISITANPNTLPQSGFPYIIKVNAGSYLEETVRVISNNGIAIGLDPDGPLRNTHPVGTKLVYEANGPEKLNYSSIAGNTLSFSSPVMLKYNHQGDESVVGTDSTLITPKTNGYDFPFRITPDIAFRLETLFDLIRAAGIQVNIVHSK